MDIDPLPAVAADPLSSLILSFIPLVASLDAAQITAIVLACLFLGVSGFISGSEISFFSLTPSQLEELEEEKGGKRIISLVKAPERLLATILIANNLVNVAIVVLFNYALGPVFSGLSPLLSFILQSVILTFLILLFGEILPKLYSNTHSLQWARFAAPALQAISNIFFPLSAVLVKSSVVVRKIVTKKTREPDCR